MESCSLSSPHSKLPEVKCSFLKRSEDVYGHDNFYQGCSFSPDGLCILTSTAADCTLRLYNLPNQYDREDKENEEETNTKGADDAVNASIASEKAIEGVTDHETQAAGEKTVERKWKTALSSQVAEAVRSYDWYPHMNSADANTCCFLATCRDQPVHLFDAYTGGIRATYCPFNNLDEMESPSIIKFSPDGRKIYTTGFRTDRTIHVFDTAIPGRTSVGAGTGDNSSILRLGKTRRSKDGQKGLISSIEFSSSPNITTTNCNHIFAVGTYSPGSIYIYDDRMGQYPAETVLNGVCIVGHGKNHHRRKQKKRQRLDAVKPHNHGSDSADQTSGNNNDNKNEKNDNNDDNDGIDSVIDMKGLFSAAKIQWYQNRARTGISQMKFCPKNEHILYSSSRKSDAVLAWDLRMLSGNPDYQSFPLKGIGNYYTDSNTNQRLQFDIDPSGKYLFIPGRDGCVRIYDISNTLSSSSLASSSSSLVCSIKNLGDAVNGVSFSPNVNSNSSVDGMVAISTGARRFPSFENDDSNDEQEDGYDIVDQTQQSTIASRANTAYPGHLYLYHVSQNSSL